MLIRRPFNRGDQQAAKGHPLLVAPISPYRLKTVGRRPDGVLSSLASETGSPELPVVFLEVQMRADPGFHQRLAAQTFRFVQLQPRVEDWRVVVITPHRRLNLGRISHLQSGFPPISRAS